MALSSVKPNVSMVLPSAILSTGREDAMAR
jgi:hypothetical protein